MNRLKTYPIIKTKSRVELSPESIALVEVQAPRDFMGNKKYQLNPEGYLPQGIIPLDLVHSFNKMPRTLFVPILNTSSKYKSIAKGSLLGTFEPIDKEVSEIQVANWTDLEGKMQKVHQQFRKKKSYRQAWQKCYDKKEEPVKFNGMYSYYRKFISHYSDISKCFKDMTRKGATFNWTKECDVAFKLLKEKLMEDPVLISPQVDKGYVIHCNASKYSYSGILQQTRPGTEELAPVAYFSGNFNKTQVKWNITEKEAYAIYKSV